jgi:hypothetical protein
MEVPPAWKERRASSVASPSSPFRIDSRHQEQSAHLHVLEHSQHQGVSIIAFVLIQSYGQGSLLARFEHEPRPRRPRRPKPPLHIFHAFQALSQLGSIIMAFKRWTCLLCQVLVLIMYLEYASHHAFERGIADRLSTECQQCRCRQRPSLRSQRRGGRRRAQLDRPSF